MRDCDDKEEEERVEREEKGERERGSDAGKGGGRYEEESLRKIQEWRQERDGTGQRDGE